MAKRVYFAFHYDDVTDFRANVVRNHNFVGGVEKAGYFDASIWEEAKRRDPTELKALIDSELEHTSVSAILIGTGTYQRRWVRYEIVKSVYRKNRVIGVHINEIAGKDGLTKTLGANPFDYLSVSYDGDGTHVTPLEWNGSVWVIYKDFSSYKLEIPRPDKANTTIQYSKFITTYSWVSDDGYKNFSSWIS